MDVDLSISHLLPYFPLDDEFPWSADMCEQILARRAAMSGSLFFDELLRLGKVKDPQELYPPTSTRALERLLDVIEGSSYDSMKRDCLVYYLLQQCVGENRIGDRADAFAREKCIAPQFVALADVYYMLDFGVDLDVAVSKLSDARIMKEYASKIMSTLALHPNSAPLIRKYVRTCSPTLREPSDLERYLLATAEYSVVEAWSFQRTFPDSFSARRDLLDTLFLWALSPKPKAQPLTQLLAVPFSSFEESVLQDFATHPPPSLPPTSVAVVRDLVCVRLIQSCKYAAAVRFDRQNPPTAGAARGTWGAERERIVKEVVSIMPAAERGMVEAELEELSEDVRIRTASAGAANVNSSASAHRPWSNSTRNVNSKNLSASGSSDLGASWEDVGAGRRMGGVGLTRKSVSGRPPRTSLSNGNGNGNGNENENENGSTSAAGRSALFTPGASTSSMRQSKTPFGADSISMSIDSTSPSASRVFGFAPANTTASASVEYVGSTTPLFAQKSPSASVSATVSVPPRVNGVSLVNGVGAKKSNAFTSRNAFFQPPVPAPTTEEHREEERSSSPLEVSMSVSAAQQRASPKRPQQFATRLPTPPHEHDDAELETEQEQKSSSPIEEEKVEHEGESSAKSVGEDEDEDAEGEDDNDHDYDHSIASDKGGDDLEYSIFGISASSTPRVRLTPSSGESTPRGPGARRGRASAAESQRKKLNVSVPGAFVEEEEHEHEHEPSPTSAKIRTKRESKEPISAGYRRPTERAQTASRKRAASPDDSADNGNGGDVGNRSMPGTLFAEDEDEEDIKPPSQNQSRANSHSNGRAHNQWNANGAPDSEEADELAPLPTSRSRRKNGPTAGLVSPALRTPRRGTRSQRGSSAEPEELVMQSTGRPVRRSSRLSTSETSPTIEHSEKLERKREKSANANMDTPVGAGARPRKSSRTASGGATATGRGAAKRR